MCRPVRDAEVVTNSTDRAGVVLFSDVTHRLHDVPCFDPSCFCHVAIVALSYYNPV